MEMASITKRRRKNTPLEGDEKKVTSSNGQLKRKYQAEMEGLKVSVVQLHTELLDTQNQKEKLASVVHDVMAVSNDQFAEVVDDSMCESFKEPNCTSTACVTSVSTSFQAMKKKQTMFEANNRYLNSVIAKEREELEALKLENSQLRLGNEQLQLGSTACRRVMQELRNNITILSNANDVQAMN
jgi:hypothetical protein